MADRNDRTAEGGADAAATAGATLPVSRVQADGDAVKFCLRTADGHEIESVIVPMGAEVEGRDQRWRTLCVSSQIGCARECAFCQTARMGLIRNLTADEIVAQVDAARQHLGADVRNVVFMGMGEPLDNFENVVAAITRWHEDRARQIPRRRVTVSTAGRCAGIRRLAALRWRRLNLAVSLNAPNDEIRSRIMPINRLEPMAALREAIAAYPVRAGGHVLIEYVMIRGLNDAAEHARQLVEYLRGPVEPASRRCGHEGPTAPLRTCVNLIPYNPCAGLPYEPSPEEAVVRFQLLLMEAGQMAFRRNPKGRQVMAACGQLGNPNGRGRAARG